MKVRVLGASGGCAAGCGPSSYLVDGRLCVDLGSAAMGLTLQEQDAVEDVLLTHSHLDHTRDLPLLLINGDRRGRPLRVHGLPSTLESIRKHLFNREIWFEAFQMAHSIIEARPIRPGETREVGTFRVTGFPLHHTVDCAGWLLDDGTGCVFFAGDTDDSDCLAPVAREAGNRLRAVFLETSFPNAMSEFARLTGHLTPMGLRNAVRVLPPGVPVFVTHMKPGFEEQIEAEVAVLGNPSLRPLRGGETLEI